MVYSYYSMYSIYILYNIYSCNHGLRFGMHNPHIKEAVGMFSQVIDKHCEDIDVATMDWVQIKDELGNILQIVPVMNVVFKG